MICSPLVHFSTPTMHNQFPQNEVSSIPIDVLFSPSVVTIWYTHRPYDCSISFPTDPLKWTNSNSSTKKIRLKSVANNQDVAHKSWVTRCFRSTPGFICNNLPNFHGFNHSPSKSSHQKDFSLSAPLSGF